MSLKKMLIISYYRYDTCIVQCLLCAIVVDELVASYLLCSCCNPDLFSLYTTITEFFAIFSLARYIMTMIKSPLRSNEPEETCKILRYVTGPLLDI